MSSRGGVLRAAERLARLAQLVASTLARTVGARCEWNASRRTTLLALAARRALEIHGLEVVAARLPPRGPALLVSNHLSYLDPLVFLSRAACVPVSKAELASWPLLGTLARRAGVTTELALLRPGTEGAAAASEKR